MIVPAKEYMGDNSYLLKFIPLIIVWVISLITKGKHEIQRLITFLNAYNFMISKSRSIKREGEGGKMNISS
jgi:hypothetical protein